MSDIIVYNNGELELNIPFDKDTIWLTQNQLSKLFDVTKQNISLHIIGIYKDKELDKLPTIKKYLTVQIEGNREVERNIEHYNLDMIISVGYRVNSKKATKFRQWATSVLKNYIQDGYVLNSDKITNDRFVSLENDVNNLKQTMTKVSNLIQDDSTKEQGVFFDGQIFDAYVFMSSLIREAKRSIVLIDNYIDESTLLHLSSKAAEGISITILTKVISKAMKLDLQKHNAQYTNIELKVFKHSHDRFLLIDDKIYHLGASLKDLGKKWFAFSLMQEDAFELKKKISEVLDEK